MENEDLEEWDNFQMENDRVRQLILSLFTQKCELDSSLHNLSDCEKYHQEYLKRRKPFKDGKLIYKCEMCDYIENKEVCLNGENCNKSHNISEIMFHPGKYRTIICKNNCKVTNMKLCPYAHSSDQLRNGSSYIKNKILNFDLNQFKTVKCFITTKHNEKQCLGYHSIKDKRRNPNLINYSSEICNFAEKEMNCFYEDKCLNSHNKVETLYHPTKFKNKFCSHYILENPNSITKCQYGKFCSFAHSEEEIKIELIHRLDKNEDFFTNYFKTVSCPFTNSHEKSACVYSHNWQDFRRNPLKSTYKNNQCKKWDIKKTILSYKDGCPNEMICILCHGWKEEDFHPLNYKTKKCRNFNFNCNKKEYCPYFHQNENKRKIPKNVQDDFNLRFKNCNNNNHIKNIENNFNQNKNNKSEIINLNKMNNLYLNYNSNQYNSNVYNTNTNSNFSNNYFMPNNNSFTYTRKLIDNNYSSNNSHNSHNSFNSNYSDFKNSQRKSFNSDNSYNSLFDNLNESFGMGIINPDDSIEFNNIADKFDFIKKKNYLENFQQINNEINQLFKDSDIILENKNRNNSDNFLNFLYENGFIILYTKFKNEEITLENLIGYDDNKILSLIEFNNRNKFEELKMSLMKIEDNLEGEDLLRSLNNDLNNEDDE